VRKSNLMMLSTIACVFIASLLVGLGLTYKTDSNNYSKYVTEKDAQKAVDFDVIFPSPPPRFDKPLIEIAKPSSGSINDIRDTRKFTTIILSYYSNSSEMDGEIRIFQSLHQSRNIFTDPNARRNLNSLSYIEINGKEVITANFDEYDLYTLENNDVYIDIYVYSEYLYDDVIFIIEEILRSIDL